MELKLKGVLQENDLLYHTQEKLESELYAKEQELDGLRKDTQQWKRLHKDLDKTLAMEREEFDKDRLSWHYRETQMKDQLRHLQQQQRQQQQQEQKDRRHRSPKRKNGLFSAYSTPHIPSLLDCRQGNDEDEYSETTSKPMDLLFNHQAEIKPFDLSPTSLEALDSADKQTIRAQETIIAELKLNLEQQAHKLQQQHLLDSHEASLQLQALISQVNNIKQLNQSLMEENESYQILLHEKTICGDFMSDPMVQIGHDNQDMDDSRSHQLSQNTRRSMTSGEGLGLNLADELTMASSMKSKQKLFNEEEMMAEIKTLQDANRALQLYMNKILLRIVENKHLETILSIDEPNKTAPVTIINTTTLGTADCKTPSLESRSGSFEMDDNESSISSASSDDSVDDCDSGGGDSWTQVFRRMSSGFGGWSKPNDTTYITLLDPFIF
ncbi:hypothetical protein BC941DRAFT_453073 [Chlamydoabsidia padenii]|nr:hypothetical protein BC941DRAFT_453073 [Chlamydoabsidia padenii]